MSLEINARSLEEIHTRWNPHPGQIPIGHALLYQGILDIFVQAGRNFGKTELVCYLLWRWAQTHPGSENYYFAPFFKQANEILWEPQRIQSFGPRSWLLDGQAGINNSELRLKFQNGAFIKLDGSDNVEAYRGIKPKGLSVFDEFKDFREEFYGAYDPNRAAFNSPLVIIGTPPERECQYLSVAQTYRTTPGKSFFHAPTAQNPYIAKEWLENKKKELEGKGEVDVWQREYEAIYVPGGVSKIFPMLTREAIVDHQALLYSIRKDRNRIEWMVVTDPAGATCFAALFLGLNPYTKEIYCFDEIYETNQASMTVKTIGESIIAKRKEFGPHAEWRKVYDEAETWFYNEMFDHFDEGWEPTQKAKSDKISGISYIKDIMLSGKLKISSRCAKLFWEMDNYYKDKNGKIPKKNDHLIDCLRYALDAWHYDFKTMGRLPEEISEDQGWSSEKTHFKISDDFPDLDDFGNINNATGLESWNFGSR